MKYGWTKHQNYQSIRKVDRNFQSNLPEILLPRMMFFSQSPLSGISQKLCINGTKHDSTIKKMNVRLLFILMINHDIENKQKKVLDQIFRAII